jgi:hypothetical protein
LALLAVPALATAAFGARPRKLGTLAVRAIVPGLVVLVPALIADWSQLSYWLVHQPNYPAFNHTTPFTSISPVILYGHFYATSSGPTRLVAIGVALVVSVALCRHRPSLQRLLFVLGLLFLLRVIFEPVLDAYYTWPVLAFALVLAARAGWRRFILASAVALFATWFSNVLWIGVFPWWGIMMGLLVVLLALAWPGWDAPIPDEAEGVSVPASDEPGDPARLVAPALGGTTPSGGA